jgi:arylsulfatase A-like enzyme
MFTGWYSRRHQAVSATKGVQKSLKLLPEILYENGYTTAGFVRHGWVSNFGLDQGFEQLVARSLRKHDHQTVNDAMDWLRRSPAEPFFLFVHLFGSHDPYIAPGPYKGLYTLDFPDAVDSAKADTVSGDRSVTRTIATYDECVRYVDDQLGRLLRSVENGELLERTVIVVTSDHGEALGELRHGCVPPTIKGHTRVLYDEVLRVPMVLHLPWVSTSTKEISDKVEHIDLMPSILELIGVSCPVDTDGRSWAQLVTEEGNTTSWSRRNFFADTIFKEPTKPDPRGEYLTVWRVGNLKYMAGFSDYDGEILVSQELYDIEKDSYESTDLSSDQKDVCDHFRAELLDFVQVQVRPNTAGDQRESLLDDEQIKLLKSLGYL